jgi:hypothetical protein
MPKRQLVTSKPAGSSTQTTLSTSSSSSSTRINTHVLLALSFLVLSANARPLNVLGHEFNIGNLLNGENLNAPNMKGGITEQMYVSLIMIGRLLSLLTDLSLFLDSYSNCISRSANQSRIRAQALSPYWRLSERCG